MHPLLSPRERAIIVGLFVSKYDEAGLHQLGFEHFRTAYNAFGLALGVNPESIKNYRDEFDPLFPNPRRGRDRPIRPNCLAIFQRYSHLQMSEFTDLLRSLIYSNPVVENIIEQAESSPLSVNNSFAKRLLTGVAAERYFRTHYSSLPVFTNYELEDTTYLGCGFDFRLHTAHHFFGVEVKGLNEQHGTVSLTAKEHRVAEILGDDYFLFIVKNFRDKPVHELVQNPLNSHLVFQPRETRMITVDWLTRV